ncbi:GTP binding signal recognition particle receptor [Scheffersomyces xylosifermentans]|uniref:GTP binding signal recognition particle receptor n=1 Tax=Scheffersomyces xylosifermentans TaxID=1304137 RepID=UPI00315DA635
MSQSLIIFRPSGRIEYQYNNKITPFNEFIYNIVNETHTELEPNFLTKSLHQKRFYAYKRDDVYAALYFDAVTTIDGDKIQQTLSGIVKTFNKLNAETDGEDNKEQYDKLKKLVDLQFNQLMKLKSVETPVAKANGVTPLSSANNSGTSTPVRKGALNKTTNKKMRKWDGDQMVESGDTSVLDYSASKEGSATPMEGGSMVIDESAFVHENELVLVNELNDILNGSDDEDDEEGSAGNTRGGFFSKITSYLGGSINIEDVSKKFYDQLISKNIAPEMAKNIIEKIKSKLGNQNVTLATYKQALTEELTKILTPNVSTDLLYDIKRNAANPRPYVISVVGVNGVGKSTNLAKLAYWFLQNNLNVLICACDTFRSGAVEQLKVHVNNLKNLNNQSSNNNTKIDIFEKGYGSGDHVVTTAKMAIQYAANEKFDIVLIDTAGRTHSNTKLMAPLKKFGDAANPDKIIMVGEALVGTDSVEQAINFNNAFGNKRNLDFFIISKVDTVGDLVGTMINMVMATKVPILFVGTGQTYTDIKRLSVKRVVDMLMN